MTDAPATGKRALIYGITGQDGSYLAEMLLQKGYVVHGVIRRASTFNTQRIDHLYADPHDPQAGLYLHYGDMTDAGGMLSLLQEVQPDEVYNLAAQSHVRVSFDQPAYTAHIVAIGTVHLLEALRKYRELTQNDVRFYQASSSEMYGNAPAPQDESTPFWPASPYACAKVHAYHATVNYRDAYGLFACNGILFNHESPRRGETFVTRKITRAATRIQLGLQSELFLGNLDAGRDWGFAGDYVRAMWLMLQQDQPDDYVIATGKTHTVREFLDTAFSLLGMDWQKYVHCDMRYMRPSEVHVLQGNPAKARERLHWEPAVTFDALVAMMVAEDMDRAQVERLAANGGLTTGCERAYYYTSNN